MLAVAAAAAAAAAVVMANFHRLGALRFYHLQVPPLLLAPIPHP